MFFNLCVQVIKYMARLAGQPTHVAMYSTVNEFEQCRKQALTLTKGLSFVDGYYKEIEEGLEAHGHPPTAAMWTDNARGSRSFIHCLSQQ